MVWIFLGFALIMLIDFLPLAQKHNRKGMIAFLLVFIPALTLAVLLAAGIRVPSTMAAWEVVIRWLGLAYPP